MNNKTPFSSFTPSKEKSDSEARELLGKIQSEILKAFSHIPDYGCLSFSITLNEKEPVRFESGRSESRKLLKKVNRGGKE